MRHPLRTIHRHFGFRAVVLGSTVLAWAASGNATEMLPAPHAPPGLRPAPAWDRPIRLPAVAEGVEAEMRVVDQRQEPAPLRQPALQPRRAAAPRYFSGLARDPDEVLAEPLESPIQLVSLTRSLNMYQPAENGPDPMLPSEEPIGQAPPDNSREFLRSVTVLLQPGQIQFDWGVEYSLQKTTTPGIALVDNELVVFDQELRDRRLLIPFAARLGVAPRVQAFVRAPIGWTQAEFANRFGEATDDTFNVADVNAGLNLLLRDGRGQRADLIGSIGFTAPTGKHPFEDQVAVAALGDGFWSIDASLLWIRSYDPVVVFWGVGYRHLFERSYLGVDVAPGEQVNYNLGVGFAVNDRVTISSAFIGQYVTETKFDRDHIPGSDREPMSVRMAMTAITGRNRIVEPFVRFGLTDDATDAEFGVIVTRGF